MEALGSAGLVGAGAGTAGLCSGFPSRLGTLHPFLSEAMSRLGAPAPWPLCLYQG